MSELPLDVAEPEDRLGMTDEQWERFQAYTHGFGEQDENGVDISLLRENLRLTPGQRVEKLSPWLILDQEEHVKETGSGFRAVLAALRAHDVRFVLIGGLAMISHGSAYFTRDIDVHYARDAVNLSALAEALAPLRPRLRGAPEGLPFRWDAQTLRSGMNFTLVTDTAEVDVLGDVAGVASFEQVWEHSQEVELFGVTVRVASLDDLIAMKRAAGRPKDQAHLMELQRLRSLVQESQRPQAEE
jgi:predicted nucleotidyltransferase